MWPHLKKSSSSSHSKENHYMQYTWVVVAYTYQQTFCLLGTTFTGIEFTGIPIHYTVHWRIATPIRQRQLFKLQNYTPTSCGQLNSNMSSKCGSRCLAEHATHWLDRHLLYPFSIARGGSTVVQCIGMCDLSRAIDRRKDIPRDVPFFFFFFFKDMLCVCVGGGDSVSVCP